MLTDKKILFYFLFFIILVKCSKHNEKQKMKFKCNADKIESNPNPATKSLPSPKNLRNKRTLNGDDFKDFNIYLDLVNFNNEAELYGITNEVKEMLVEGMTKAVNTLKTLLKVKPISSNYIFSDEIIKAYKINDWNKSNIGSDLNKGM